MKKYNKNSIRIISSNITSRLGNSVFDYANQMLISRLFPNSLIFIGIYQSSEQIIGIIFNLFAGALADNINRKKMLILTDVLSGLVCLLGFAFLPSEYVYFVLIIGNILLAMIHTFNLPIYNAIVKESIEESYIEKHISYFSIFKESTKVIAPLAGLIIWSYFGIYFAYIFNAITFFVSALISMKITKINETSIIEKNKKKNIFIQIKEGLVYIYNNNAIKKLLIISSGINFFLSAYNLLLPYLDQYYEKELTGFYGMALIIQSMGAVIFSFINTKILNDKDKNGITENKMILSLFLLGISISTITFLDFLNVIYLKLLPYLLVGGFLTLFNIQFFSIVQKVTSNEYIGRVYSVIFTISILFMPLGSMIFGKILSIDNLFGMLISGLGIIFSVIIYFIYNTKI
ncbi:MAG: MFS transporter [Peptoniphilaceae bacterium]|uniref:MFS transporter n=1 Tax=Parvimonas sp. TaxID=1944660 RepID=UPI0025D61C9F|nr:MFS transporter [Parvimonas sp.]MCI5996668.1 MFS transporter [Parvimonas sp.]MDD7764949.1 MFS transporter [Peptoniphilaceae bacterium]MDY3050367.1 MFS transporter [Parvimonas sp.]